MKVTDRLTLTNEDNMELMARYPDGWFELAIVDPPYGIGINSSGRLKRYNNGNNTWDNKTPDKKYFGELFRVSKNQIVWGGNYFDLPPTRCFLIWDKKQPEGISFASAELAWASFDKSIKTFYCNPLHTGESRIHTTQKPVALYKWLLQNYAKEGDKILDTHLGSMSIAIACHDMGFELTGCELDKDYYEAGIKRVKQHISQLQLFL